jgi:SAM-dependent methyltransferase
MNRLSRWTAGLRREMRALRGRLTALPPSPVLVGRLPEWITTACELPTSSVPDSRDEAYVRFENVFYDTDTIARNQSLYLPRIAGATESTREKSLAVDVGCGRGEFLKALAATGVPMVGLEPNRFEAEQLRAEGYDVRDRDALSGLAEFADSSLGAISILQVIEHLQPSYCLDVIALACRKLAPGGLLVIEAPNYECPAVQYGFWIDLTHVRPYPAQAIAHYMIEGRLEDLELIYSVPVQSPQFSVVNPAANYVNYALLGRKVGSPFAPDLG